jgi:hypothetical protein
LKKEFEEKQSRKVQQAEEKSEDEESDIGSDVWVRDYR